MSIHREYRASVAVLKRHLLITTENKKKQVIINLSNVKKAIGTHQSKIISNNCTLTL